jgi:hypothetical protein
MDTTPCLVWKVENLGIFLALRYVYPKPGVHLKKGSPVDLAGPGDIGQFISESQQTEFFKNV